MVPQVVLELTFYGSCFHVKATRRETVNVTFLGLHAHADPVGRRNIHGFVLCGHTPDSGGPNRVRRRRETNMLTFIPHNLDSVAWLSRATTFRLRANGLTIFLDTWLDRPSVLPKHLAVDDVTEADYIFISHAHFDHLPGADRIAKKTGATVIANGEAITLLRSAGVHESQL
ncbi:hypothetical protein CMUS01_16588, partial [Colletotrichum musicola]